VEQISIDDMRVHAELRVPQATVQIVRFDIHSPFFNAMTTSPDYRLDLCLTPRPGNARACFRDRWGPHRFEPLGDLFLVPPDHRMDTRGERGWQSSILCHLRRDLVDRWLGDDGGWSDRRLEAALDIGHPHIRGLLIRLAEEAHRPDIGGAELATHAVGQLAIEIGRFVAGIDDRPVAGGLAAWRLALIDQRLRDLQCPPALAELAKMCSLSVRQLTRGFRTSRGCSIKDHIARSRIEAAKRLLLGGDSVKTIAFAVGFASPSSFAYAFRAVSGVTPRQFRQRVRRATG
jgi:AraC family transcriptional regulator